MDGKGSNDGGRARTGAGKGRGRRRDTRTKKGAARRDGGWTEGIEGGWVGQREWWLGRMEGEGENRGERV